MNTSNPLNKSHKAGKSKAVISTIIAALVIGALASCREATPPTTEKKPAVEKNQGDLTKLQGKWTCMADWGQRWVKEINGNKETFTIFSEGEAVYNHTHTVSVSKQGPVRIYATSAGQITIGEHKGEATEPFSFIYKLNNGSLIEGLGLLDEVNHPGNESRIVTWKRPQD